MSPPGKRRRIFGYGALLSTLGVAVSVPLYNRAEPALAGIPFFYWFQFAWIVVTALVTGAAYLAGVE